MKCRLGFLINRLLLVTDHCAGLRCRYQRRQKMNCCYKSLPVASAALTCMSLKVSYRSVIRLLFQVIKSLAAWSQRDLKFKTSLAIVSEWHGLIERVECVSS